MKYEHLTAEWAELYNSGLSFSEIAKRYNTTTRTVHRTLQGMVEVRPKSKFEQYYEEWYKLYVNMGFSKQDIGIKYGTSAGVVSKALEKLGIKPNTQLSKRKYTKYLPQWIEKYQRGESLQEIANSVDDATAETVRQYLEREGIEIRGYSEAIRKYHIKDKAFDRIDTEFEAYMLGLIFSTGSLLKDLSLQILNISCVEENREIGDKISEFLGESNFYFRKKPEGHSELTWRYCSKHLFESLNVLGLGVRKGESTTFPKLSQALTSAFILGYWEGRGTYPRDSKPYIAFSAPKAFLEALQEILSDVADVSGMLIRQNKQYETYSMIIYRRDVWEPVLQWMYARRTFYSTFRKPPFLLIDESEVFK